jgi:hypothetical protein
MVGCLLLTGVVRRGVRGFVRSGRWRHEGVQDPVLDDRHNQEQVGDPHRERLRADVSDGQDARSGGE